MDTMVNITVEKPISVKGKNNAVNCSITELGHAKQDVLYKYLSVNVGCKNLAFELEV